VFGTHDGTNRRAQQLCLLVFGNGCGPSQGRLGPMSRNYFHSVHIITINHCIPAPQVAMSSDGMDNLAGFEDRLNGENGENSCHALNTVLLTNPL